MFTENDRVIFFQSGHGDPVCNFLHSKAHQWKQKWLKKMNLWRNPNEYQRSMHSWVWKCGGRRSMFTKIRGHALKPTANNHKGDIISIQITEFPFLNIQFIKSMDPNKNITWIWCEIETKFLQRSIEKSRAAMFFWQLSRSERYLWEDGRTTALSWSLFTSFWRCFLT